MRFSSKPRYAILVVVLAFSSALAACSDIHKGQWLGPGDVSDSEVDVLDPHDIVDVSGQDLFKPDTHGKDVADIEGVDINHVDVPADTDVQIGRDVIIGRDINGDADAVHDGDVTSDLDVLPDGDVIPDRDVTPDGDIIADVEIMSSCADASENGPCDSTHPCLINEHCVDGECIGEQDPSCTCPAPGWDCGPHEDVTKRCSGFLVCDRDGANPMCVFDPNALLVCPPEADTECSKNLCNELDGECAMTDVREGLGCDDGSFCTFGEKCFSGVCGSGTTVICEDDNVCTTDSCNPATGCVYTANTVQCADPRCEGGSFYAAARCAAKTCGVQFEELCDDTDDCTLDGCDPETGCTHVLICDPPCEDPLDCSDDLRCTKDACNMLTGECTNTPVDCGDLNDCTNDFCRESDGLCVNDPIEGGCGTGGTCQAGTCMEPLTVTRSGVGAGTVTSVPTGVDCGTTCQVMFEYGSSVELKADADTSSCFDGWSGDCIGVEQCDFAMTSSRSVEAAFSLKTTWYMDFDGDEHGDAVAPVQLCGIPAGYVQNHDDCDDHDGATWPGAPDVVGGVCLQPSETFTTIPVATNITGYPTVGVGPEGFVHVLYVDADTKVQYATNASGSWVSEQISSGNGFLAIQAMVVDGAGVVHLVFKDNTSKNLKYAFGNSGNWTYQDITAVNAFGQGAVLALDQHGYAHVAYQDYALGYPAYATNVSGSWVSTLIASTGAAYYLSIAADGSGKAHVSWAEMPDGGSVRQLRYATNASGTWAAVTVYNNGGVGNYSSIAVDGSNNVFIAFYDSPGANLGFSTNVSGTWVTTLPDTGGDTGAFSSLVLDDNGKAHIVYQGDAALGQPLRYITNASGSWVFKDIDSVARASAISAAMDQNGFIHVAYERGGVIRYAVNCGQFTSGKDTNCDGVDGVDADGDRWASVVSGGTDCNDSDPLINPGAVEIENGVDDDCDGKTDEGFCVPDCTLRECGSDGCDGLCGVCVGGTCESGLCVDTVNVLIPSGSFWMGCNAVLDGDCGADEYPYHEVKLSGYYMDKTEVTVSAYRECVAAGLCTTPDIDSSYCNWNKAGKEADPVNCIDWFQSRTYCEWAGKRLPTEAEWEKAARGMDGRKYPWGIQTATCAFAVMNDAAAGGSGCGSDSSAEVCSKAPAGNSPYGLCDMAGNVWEWVSDWYGSDYYSSSPFLNPAGPADGSARVARGGSFMGESPAAFRTSARVSNAPLYDEGNLGFRCADECVPVCTGLQCGDDGCGGSCGTCVGGSCVLGNCVETEKVLIPTGSFWMGCNEAVDTECNPDESPYHEVKLSGYYMDKTEVTQAAYLECVAAGQCAAPSSNWDPVGSSNKPVISVDWGDAGAYCMWAGKRLPTEAEWEKAARGTDGRKFPWGNQTATCDYAVMDDGAAGGSGCGTSSLMSVCSKTPTGDSPYGLCDMSGNVWEWVQDWYHSSYSGAPSNGSAWESPVGSYRVMRGGAFYDGGSSLRVSYRYDYDPLHSSVSVGFRCAQECVPDCTGHQCGDDGCGGSCGVCDTKFTCSSKGTCEPVGMVPIPAGAFWMGCNEAVDTQCDADESPYHQVTLSGYYMDMTEVTVEAYGECVTAAACSAPSTGGICNWERAGTEQHPVNCVDWLQSKTYCEWVNKHLPTEAQWEKASRGPDGRKYPWGNQTADCDHAVMNDASGVGCGAEGTMSVCSKSPAGNSPYGICDMSGNVFEWVSDWYDSEYYSSSPLSDPAGPGSGSFRINRGGSFYYDAYLRAADRNIDGPSARDYDNGFRCAKDACEPDCTGKVCGSDGCGGFCGTCVGGTCQSGVCVDTPKVLIPTGSFWMGCNITVDSQCETNESPYHEVTLSGYYMDTTEVTQAAYLECVLAGACTAPSTGGLCNWNVTGKANHPVNCIDWNQSKAYCEWADRRLPTEAEWEKAARGTDGRKYPWGNETATCELAVINEGVGIGCGTNSTMSVCSKSPDGDSLYGLCDMSGNVWEWVSDWYGAEYYSISPTVDPIGPLNGTYRVGRGGGFGTVVDAAYLRVSFRNDRYPSDSRDNVYLGFRCAQDCVPDCTLRECGDDGCGGSCGVCVGGTCESGLCAETPKILIPAGSFWMGCNVAVDGDCGAEESPYHEVTLSGYYMDKTEVTVAAYGECVTAGSCTAPSTGGTCTWGVTGHEQHPVNCIDWFQSEAYCEWAGKQLPTEAQWEKAARGTDGRKYPWGNQAATCDHAVKFGCGGPGGAQTVCSKSPAGDSPYGLCDMAGNAPEWVSDWYSETYYSVSPDTDPVGPASGSYRVFRGGGFDFIGDFYFRTSFRSSNFALDTVNIVMGFRCATNVP